jgi:hypothetical protein
LTKRATRDFSNDTAPGNKRVNYLLSIGGGLGHAVAQLVDALRYKRVRFPMGVTKIFYWLHPSGRTVALRSTQSPTVVSTSDVSWGGGGEEGADAQG